jgi:hypothetical protein
MKNENKKAITNCKMTKLNLTNNEKLLIFDACNGDVQSLSLYPLNFESYIRFYYGSRNELSKIFNKDNFICKIEESVFENGLYDKYEKMVNFESFFKKLESLTRNELRQLFNEAFAFWNKRELMEIAEYCRFLLENTNVRI